MKNITLNIVKLPQVLGVQIVDINPKFQLFIKNNDFKHNSVSISSYAAPELRVDGIYIRGYNKAYDFDLTSRTYINDAARDVACDKILAALEAASDAFNASIKALETPVAVSSQASTVSF